MAAKKKLQVFVSSTFEDLKAERQAAVEAILTAGHIPAGMELFTAGDQSQMNVIKLWIDESDVYLLILGFRYGSIEPESKKSYTHLEYEYALEKGKSLFAVVVDERCKDDRVKTHPLGVKIIEQENPQQLKSFRSLIQTKMVRHWSDTKDIKIAVMETMHEFSLRDELVGWVSGNEAVNGGMLAEEMARLAKENERLREIAATTTNDTTYSGLTFDEMFKLLKSHNLIFIKSLAERKDIPAYSFLEEIIRNTPESLGESANLLHGILYLELMAKSNNLLNFSDGISAQVATELKGYGLIALDMFPPITSRDNQYVKAEMTSDGIKFALKLKTKYLPQSHAVNDGNKNKGV